MYNFNKVVDRKNTSSLKWDIVDNELPMWVADMDFVTVPEVISAIQNKAALGIYGYSIIPYEWNHAIASFWARQYKFSLNPDHLVFCTGVVAALSSIVRKLTTPGEKVLIQTPVYGIFFNSIVNNGRFVVENELAYNSITQEYSIDFKDLEDKLADPQTTMMILCNPHNPVGKIWDKETLYKIGELCWKYNVIVVSDEIHCSITDPDKTYIPFASVSEHCAENSITCISSSKTFNMAGIQSAAIYVPNKNLRYKATRGLNTDEVAEPNVFAIDATIAAFNHGDVWLKEFRDYIYANKKKVNTYLKDFIPQLKLVPSDATYLLWIDCASVCDNAKELVDRKSVV